MAKTRAKVKHDAVSVALELLEVRQQINELKRVDKVLSEELKRRMHDGEKQTTYTLRKDMTLAVSDALAAHMWAATTGCLKVDLPSVDRFLKSNRLAVPPGFGIREVEKLVEVRENEIAKEEFLIEGGV